MSESPRVSIGIPVRNGERFLGEAVESLLSQTFTDLEVVICDNASTDRTQEICEAFAARDPRVRYFRNSTNLGPAGNHNKCVSLARGQYFRWHAHDDMCLPTYLARCVEALDGDPSVVLVYPCTVIVDEKGEVLENYDFRPATDSVRPSKRFGSLVMIHHRSHRAVEIFGLMRMNILRQTPLEGAYARADSVLLARMALFGRFIELPQRLFLSRSHSSQSMQTLPTKTGISKWTSKLGTGPLPPPEWWDASRKGKMNFPEWNLFKEYWISVPMAPLDFGDRLRCHAVVLLWLMCNPHKLITRCHFRGTEACFRNIFARLTGSQDRFKDDQRSSQAMKVAILAGGMGTRFAEETDIKPKPMIESRRETDSLAHSCSTMPATGMNDFVIALGYRGEFIKKLHRRLRYVTASDLTVSIGSGDVMRHGNRSSGLDDRPRRHRPQVTMTGGRIKRLQALRERFDFHDDLGRRRLQRQSG